VNRRAAGGGRPRSLLARSAKGAIAQVMGALAQLAPQLAALVLLDAGDFGKFSLVYIIYAWALSLQLSIVCEPAARYVLVTAERPSAHQYFATSVAVGATLAVVSTAVAGFMWHSLPLSALTAAAVLAAALRGGARYWDVLLGGWSRALPADAALVLTFGGTLVVLLGYGVSSTFALLAAWTVGACAALLIGSRPRAFRPSDVRLWLSHHRNAIVPLVKESLVLDASSIGTPFLVAPFLSTGEFGVYRAVSNVAAPVRLVLEPLRPLAVRVQGEPLARRVVVTVPVIGAVLGGAAWLALAWLGRQDVDLGVASDLAPYAWLVGAFTWGNFVSAAFYYLARVHASPTGLWRGRLIQSGTAVVMPLAGVMTAGLLGAMVGYVAATVVGSIAWAVLWKAKRPVTQAAPRPSNELPNAGS
jgi:hypothetical protein